MRSTRKDRISGGRRRTWRRFVAASISGIAGLGMPNPERAFAVCPDTPAECLGDAAHFSLVTEGKAKIGSDLLTDHGFTYWAWTTVEGDVCADRVSSVSPPPAAVGDYGSNAENVAVRASSGFGVTGSTVGPKRPESVGLKTGLIATGGSLVGPRVSSTSVDTSGTNPLVDRCRDAHPAAVTAAATLGALPATAELGNVSVAVDEFRTIPLPAEGLNVFDAEGFRLARGSFIYFEDQGSASWVVVRTKSLSTSIFADMGSDVPVIFLLSGKGSAVSIGRFSDLFSAGILAPDRYVKVQGEGSVEGIWAKKAVLTGVLLGSGNFQP